MRVTSLLGIHQAEVDNGANILFGAQHGQTAAVSSAFWRDLDELTVAEHAAHEDNAVVDIGHAGRQ